MKPDTTSEWRRLRQNLAHGARLMLLRKVRRQGFHISLGQLLLLLGVETALAVLADWLRVTGPVDFNVFAVHMSALSILLWLLAFAVLTHRLRPARPLLSILVVSTAAGAAIALLELLLVVLGPLRHEHYGWVGYWLSWGLFILFLLMVYRVLNLHWKRSWQSHARATGVYALIAALPLWLLPNQDFWYPKYDAEAEAAKRPRVNAEQIFYAQPALLKRVQAQLRPQRPGVSDIYFVGFGSFAEEDVFMKEIRVIRELFDSRFDTDGRSVALVNNVGMATDTPIASATNLERVLKHIGRKLDRDEDVLVLYLTTHGSRKHQLSVSFDPLSLNAIDPPRLRQVLDDSGIKWKVVVISACFSGGFIEALRDPYTLVMTSADAKRESFGCGALSDFTYFGQALFDDALRRTRSFPDAFHQATARIVEREKQERLKSSNPQMAVGSEIEKRLADLTRELNQRLPVTATRTAAVPPVPADASCARPAC
jgi:Peptidase C13 family